VGWRAGLLGLVVVWVLPGTAQALAPCKGVTTTAVTPILTGQGSLESVIVDMKGRLFYTDSTLDELRRLDAPGAQPKTIAKIPEPGGLAIDDDGQILVGSGSAIVSGIAGNLSPHASLLRVSPEGGPVAVVATGLEMTNGLARASNGAIFASSDVGIGIDRVGPDGGVTVGWALVVSGNGLAIDNEQRHLYAAQTFVPAAIARVDLRDPRRVETFAMPPLTDVLAGLDGMTIDGDDRLFVAAQVPGAIWRVNRDRTICTVGTGLTNPSAVAFGYGDHGFLTGHLYSVGFDGTIAEVTGARTPGVSTAALRERRLARIAFLPRSARVRDGRARVRPLVQAVYNDGLRRRLVARVTVGGRRGRTGRLMTIPVEPHARTLTASFIVRGLRRTRTITLLR
jgi:sugar lactone lactonase YvrE